MLLETYNKYLGLGFQMIKIGNNKRPIFKRNYNEKTGHPCKKSHEYNQNSNYGCVPPKSIMVIDVDIKNGKKGFESLKKLEKDLGYKFTPTVQTGSGGLHIYVYINKSYKLIQNNYKDIDFLTYKNDPKIHTPYCVAGEQIIKVDNKDYEYKILNDNLYINTVPNLDEVLDESLTIIEDNDMINESDLYDKLPVKDLKNLLEWIPSDDYHEWVANGAVIKNEISDDKEAFKLFNEWSGKSANYKSLNECLDKWKNIGKYKGKKRTVGTLYFNGIQNKLNELIKQIKKCENKELIIKLLKDGRWLDYPKFTDKTIKNDINKTVVNKLNNLNSKHTYNDIQKITNILYGKEINEINNNEIDNSKLSDFVRVSSFTRLNYFQISNNSRHDQESVNMLLSDELQEISKEQGLKKNLTVQQAFQKKLLQYATQHEYNPTKKDRIFKNQQGQVILNTFDDKTVPNESLFTVEGKRLINKFVNHLKTIMDQQEAEILLDWLAYITQNMGKKILWVPLIQSIEGMGKSIIGNLLIHHVFGKANAGVVDPIVLTDTNNSWATDKMLKILEEVKLSGHNRYEVLNNLKPLITNPYITRKEKFEVSSEVNNYCNFMAFTNYKDALPVDEEDRRWWIVFSKIDNLNELEKKVGMSRQDYFTPLHELAKSNSPYGSEFKTFLLQRNIDNFNPNFPPKSNHKEELKEIEKSKMLGMDEIIELIVNVYKTAEPKVINIKLIKQASENACDDKGNRITPKSMLTKDIRNLLNKLNYKSVTKKQYPTCNWKGISPMFINSKTCTIDEAIAIWENSNQDKDFLVEQFDQFDDIEDFSDL